MDYRHTKIPFLQEDCINEFGQETGTKIYELSCELFASMAAEADFRNNKSIKEHIVSNILPTIAYYLTLQNCGYSKEDAYNFALKENQKAANIQKVKNETMGKLPFAYQIFKLFIKSIMKNMYPTEGWETQWIRFDNKEIHLNFTRCIYVELTAHYACPELCTVFCKNDPVVFSGYEPKIQFKRNGTLAEGASCCDFHYTPGR